MSEPHKARILIALGMDKRAIVMTTDSAWVTFDVEAISAYTDDLGILDPKDYDREPGVYLWDGVLTNESNFGPGYEPYTAYKGTLRTVDHSELAYLLSLAPPDECQLCGKPMGDETGDVHKDCADREAFEAAQG